MSNNFASRLIQARTARGWSTEDLAKKAGIAPEVIARIESGQMRDGWQFSNLATALGVDLRWLATGIEEKVPAAVGTQGMQREESTFASRLKATRLACGFSQQQLAERVGIRQTTIANLESGRNKRCRESMQLAAILEVSEKWLLTGEEDASPVVNAPMPSALPPNARMISAAKRQLLQAIAPLSLEHIEQLIGIAEVLGRSTPLSSQADTVAHKAFERRPLLFQEKQTMLKNKKQ
jgi:transcriptional regulator with XRE-family HTH domain